MSRQKAILGGGARVGAIKVDAVPDELKHNLGPIIKIDPRQIKFNPKNKDFRDEGHEDFDRFVDDIREHGIHDPILLRPDYMLIAGERRTRAALKLGLASIEARIYYGDLSRKRERLFIVRDNLIRRQLNANRKEALIHEYYAKELKEDNRGKKNSQNLAKKVSEEMHIPLGTAKRVIAKARKPAVKKKKAKVDPAVAYAMNVQEALSSINASWRKVSELSYLPSADKETFLKAASKVVAAINFLKAKPKK